MSESVLVALPVQVVTWLCLYLLLLFGRQWLERWLVARFQRRRVEWTFCPVVRSHRQPGAVARTLAALSAMLVGAMIPLAPEIVVGNQSLSFHILGNSSVSLLYTLAIGWIGTGLMAFGIPRPGRPPVWRVVGTLLLQVLPVLLIALNLILTASALHTRQESTLSLVTLIVLQGRWGGMRWLGILQPLALVLWLTSSVPPCLGAQVRRTFAWQAQALNWALLTGALFLGGWQGPLVERYAWLGFLYTAAKMGVVTFLWTWARVTLPFPDLFGRARTVWRVVVPLVVLNLVLTALIVVAA